MKYIIYCINYNDKSYFKEFNDLEAGALFSQILENKYDTILVLDSVTNILIYKHEKKIV